jgi:hypothetical protein
MVRVYVWKFAGSAVGWGHASMEVLQRHHRDRTYISWWPSPAGREPKFNGSLNVRVPELRLIYSAPAIKERTYEQDCADESGGPDRTVPIIRLDETAILKFWNKLRTGKDPNWRTLTRNCSTTVAHALHAGFQPYDIPLGHMEILVKNVHFYWQPADVLRYAVAIQQKVSFLSIQPNSLGSLR